MLLYRISPVSIKRVLKSVTIRYTRIQLIFKSIFPPPKKIFNPIFLPLIFIFAPRFTPRRLYSRKKRRKKGEEKEKKRRNNKTRRPFQYFTIDSHFPLIFLSLSPLSSTQITRQTVNARSFPCHVRWQKRNRINLDPISVQRDID